MVAAEVLPEEPVVAEAACLASTATTARRGS